MVEVYEKLKAEGIKPRAISMPSWELFEDQDQAYKDSVMPPTTAARVSIEAAGVFGWHRYVGAGGATVGMKSFGASAPLSHLNKKFGFTVEAVVAAAKDQVARNKSGQTKMSVTAEAAVNA